MGLKKIIFVIIVFLMTSGSCKEKKNVQEKTTGITQQVSETIEKNTDNVLLLQLMTNAKDIFHHESLPCKESFSYIGQLKDNVGNAYKIANYSFEWGDNCKFTTRILVFTENGKYIGNYYTQGILPNQIIDNQLYFEDGEKVSFTDKIPQKLRLSDISFDFEPAET